MQLDSPTVVACIASELLGPPVSYWPKFLESTLISLPFTRAGGFSCFILLDGTTDQLRAVIDHLNQRYFKAPLKYTIYNYKDGKVTCRLFGELRPQIRPENIFEDLVWITLKLLN